MNVVELTTVETYPLRFAVLRRDTPTKQVSFPEDDGQGTCHLGIRDHRGQVVAVSSWVPRNCPAVPSQRGIQLRGMATHPDHQGQGVGGLLLETGTLRAQSSGFDLLWANARDVALDFYRHHACQVVGDGFIDENTQLPHHLVIRWLADLSAVSSTSSSSKRR